MQLTIHEILGGAGRGVACVSLLLCLMLGGCVSTRHDNAARLMARPDFQTARTAAPEWCRDALKTINSLEYELERK